MTPARVLVALRLVVLCGFAVGAFAVDQNHDFDVWSMLFGLWLGLGIGALVLAR